MLKVKLPEPPARSGLTWIIHPMMMTNAVAAVASLWAGEGSKGYWVYIFKPIQHIDRHGQPPNHLPECRRRQPPKQIEEDIVEPARDALGVLGQYI